MKWWSIFRASSVKPVSESASQTPPVQDVPFWRRKRYFVASMVFLGTTIANILRSNFAIAVVDMTSPKNVSRAGQTIVEEAEFNWTSLERGLLLSSHSYTHLFSFVGGILGCEYGGTRLFGLAVLGNGVLTLMTPLSVHFSWPYLFVLRLLEGVFSMFITASCLQIFVKWAPFDELFRMVNFSFSGLFVGVTVAFPMCGFMLEEWGWQYVFLVSGGMAILWYAFWFLFVSEDPSKDALILEDEKRFIDENVHALPKQMNYPWKKILTSRTVLALLNERFVESWSLSFALDCLPSYVKDSFDVSISQVGLISSVPHVSNFLGYVIGAQIGDILRNGKKLSLPKVYISMITVGQLTCVFLFIVMGLWVNFIASLVCMSVLRFMYGCAESAYTAMPIDTAGEYAGLIHGLSMSVLATGLILNPIFVGLIVPNRSLEEWCRYFLFLSAFNAWGAIIFLFFGSVRPEPWTEAGNRNVAVPRR